MEPDFTQADQIFKELQKEDTTAQTEQATKIHAVNPFPVEAFPRGIQEILRATNLSLRFPLDFTGTSMLCATATAIGNSYTASVMNGWQESAVIYAALVAPPGANKSHPLDFAFAPLAKQDDKAYLNYAQERKEYDMIQGLPKKQRDFSQTSDESQKPVLKKLLMSDFTPEALTEAHSNNGRGICVAADELAGFIKNLNRYNNGGDAEFWLSAWSGKTVSVDRVSRMSIRIKRPFIPIIGTIQNNVLLHMAKDGKSDNGFLDRFLFAMPHGVKKEHWSEVSLDEAHMLKWEKYLANLSELKLEIDEWGTPIPRQLHFSPSAWARLKTWQAYNTDLCNAAETDALKGVYTKLENYTIRFALILQLLAWACDEAEKNVIELKAVEGAIMLTDYFRSTARVVQRIIQKEDPLDRYDDKKRKLYELLPQCFTTAEGLLVATRLDFPERTFKTFLKDKVLFLRPEYGHYEKQL